MVRLQAEAPDGRFAGNDIPDAFGLPAMPSTGSRARQSWRIVSSGTASSRPMPTSAGATRGESRTSSPSGPKPGSSMRTDRRAQVHRLRRRPASPAFVPGNLDAAFRRAAGVGRRRSATGRRSPDAAAVRRAAWFRAGSGARSATSGEASTRLQASCGRLSRSISFGRLLHSRLAARGSVCRRLGRAAAVALVAGDAGIRIRGRAAAPHAALEPVEHPVGVEQLVAFGELLAAGFVERRGRLQVSGGPASATVRLPADKAAGGSDS